MSPPIVNLGDEVEVTGPDRYGNDTEKKTLTICMLWLDEGKTFYSDRYSPWYPASSLRLAPQFTIGNLVEVVRASNYDSRHLVGEKFTIDDIEGDRYTAVGYPWIRADCLRLVEELKIGDWVEVIGPDGALNDYYRGRKFRISQTPCQASDMFSCEFYPNYFPTKSLRKLTPAGALCHITKRHSEYIDASLEALEGRISAIEKRQEEARKYSDDLHSITETLAERIYTLQKRVEFVEKFQRDQTRDALCKGWSAGP